MFLGSAALFSVLQQNKDQESGDQDHSNDDHDIDVSGHRRKKIVLRVGGGKQCGEQIFHDLIHFHRWISAVQYRYGHYIGIFSECQ